MATFKSILFLNAANPMMKNRRFLSPLFAGAIVAMCSCAKSDHNNHPRISLVSFANDTAIILPKEVEVLASRDEDNSHSWIAFRIPAAYANIFPNEYVEIDSKSNLDSLSRRTGYQFRAPATHAKSYSIKSKAFKSTELYTVVDGEFLVVDYLVYR